MPRWIMKYSKYLSYPPGLLFCVTQIINPFLISMISANHFSQWGNSYKGDSVSIVEYLLLKK